MYVKLLFTTVNIELGYLVTILCKIMTDNLTKSLYSEVIIMVTLKHLQSYHIACTFLKSRWFLMDHNWTAL